MIFQRVLKGIAAAADGQPGLDDDGAREIVIARGIVSNWWRNAPNGLISPPQILTKLTEDALTAHLVDYDGVKETTPFISTTAGTVEIDREAEENVHFPPLYTALSFATDQFTRDGYLFHAYLYLLGRKSIELEEFAEEVRDVNLYTSFYTWHPEGEVVAKVHIPARQIEKVEKYRLADLEEQLDQGTLPQPAWTFEEPNVYRDPWNYANVRGFPESP